MQRVSQATMSVERKRQLENIGILWDVRSEQWEQGFGYLQAYKARVGHCRVPDKHRENGYGLGIWVGAQRGNIDKLTAERRKRLDGLGFVWRVPSPIPEDRRQRLDALGFEWGILGDKWEQGFKYLQAYEAREGHCRVPASHKERGYLLGRWVNKQRTRRDTLSTERLQRLDDVRFIWNARSDKWQEAFDAVL
jgi:Helicase associated domain